MMFSPVVSPIKTVKPYTLGGIADDNTDCSVSNASTFIGEEKTSVFRKTMVIKAKNVQSPNVFIVKRIDDEESTDLSLKIMEILSAQKSKVFVEETVYDEIEKRKSSDSEAKFERFKTSEENEIDLLITIGGDGTILWALQYFNHAHAPPILAYSHGTRNYLCNFAKEGLEASIKKVMDDIANGKPVPIEHRERIQCEITENNKVKVYHALNEVAILRGEASLARVECYLEDKYLASFEGDGVMVATPTGSTAYQLSAGGPVVNHLSPTMTITPIAPLNLTTRPLVLPSKLQLSFKMAKDSRKNIQLHIDGQTSVEINKNTEVCVSGSPVPLAFLMPEDGGDTLDNWIFRLRNLVGWNRSTAL